MGTYTEAIQQLYVAYFNRPADVAGLQYWEKVVADANGSTAAVSAAFAGSAEYQAAYANMNEYQRVAQVYINLFGHSPDRDGLVFWAQALANKQMSVADMVTQIASGAQGTDLVAYRSKVAAASAFSSALDTTTEALAYSGDNANSVLKYFLAGVSDEGTMKAATTPEALQKIIDGLGNVSTLPVSFTLTPGIDRLVGTLGDDIFNAWTFDPVTGNSASNLALSDFVEGSAGQDQLNIEIRSGYNAGFATIRNVETINITADAPTAIDASLFEGATLIRQNTNAGAVTKLASNTTAAFAGSTIAGALSVGAAGASAAVAFSGVSDKATLAVSGDALDSVKVSGNRVHAGDGALAALALTVTAGTDVQALTIGTDQQTTLAIAEGALSSKHLTSVDASASLGDINLAASAMQYITSIVTGAGNDRITVTKTGGQPLSVLSGDGNDTIMVTGRLATGDVIDGGAGTNTLVVATAGASAGGDPILNTVLKNFSTIQFIDSSAKAGLDAAQLGTGFTSISLEAGSAVTNVGTQTLIAHGNLTATALGYVADTSYAGNLKVTETSNGTITANTDVLTLAVKTSGSNVNVILAGDMKSAIVNLANGVDNPSDPQADKISSVSITNSKTMLTNLVSVTLAGDGSADVTNVDGTRLAMIDASALGGKLAVSSGTTQGLTYASTNRGAETIKLGAGIDHITIGASTYEKVDTITGLRILLNGDGTALATGSDHLDVTGVASTVKSFTTTQSSLGLALVDAAASAKGNDLVFAWGGDTYIYHDTGLNNVLDDSDIVVKLTGTVDLKALILVLGGTPV